MTNPYESPAAASTSSAASAQSEVNAPAISLIVVAGIAVVCGLLALGVDVLLIVSGAVERLEAVNDQPISKHTQITVRVIWGILLVLASSFVLYGAVQMLRLKSYGVAKAAAVVALVPLVGPCCVLGIPFGIWAMIVLNKPHVRAAFGE